MFLPPKFTLNHSLPKENQIKFSKKNPSLQMFIGNCASASITISRSKNFTELIMKFAILPSNFAAEDSHANNDLSKGSQESKRHLNSDETKKNRFLRGLYLCSCCFSRSEKFFQIFLYKFLVKNLVRLRILARNPTKSSEFL